LAQETGPVGLTQLAIASWQCPSSFITPDLEFPGQTWHSNCSPNWRGNCRVPVLTATSTSCKTWRRSWEAFQKCFQQWKERWAKCVESQGAYFEGD
jgi:hypothetical protein